MLAVIGFEDVWRKHGTKIGHFGIWSALSQPSCGFGIGPEVLVKFEGHCLGEGKWGRTKYRRIPKSEGDWKGRVPKCSLPTRKKTL